MDDHPPAATWPVSCHFCGATAILEDWGNWAPMHLVEDSLDAEPVVAPVCPACSDRYLRLCLDAHGRTVTTIDGELVHERHIEYVLRCPPLPGPAGQPLDEALGRIAAAIDRLADALHAVRG